MMDVFSRKGFKKNSTKLIILFLLTFHFVAVFADPIQTNVKPLKDFYMGCILSYKHIGFPDDPYVPGQSAVIDPNGGSLIRYHMNSMSPGNNMKTAYTVDFNASAAAYTSAVTNQQRDSIETHPVIRFNGDLISQLNWAQRQGFTFRGHVFVWYNTGASPTTFFRSGYSPTGIRLTKEVMTERLRNYIKEVMHLIHEG